MFKNQLKIAWRNLFKRKVFSLINILGLAIGFGCAMIIFLFVNHHLGFDTFHTNGDRIYRFVTEENQDGIEYSASVPPGFANAFLKDYTYAEKMAKMVYWGDEVLFLDGRNLKMNVDDEVRFVEADFFKIFDFPMVNGSNEVPLNEPNTAVITEDIAQRLFGGLDPVGQTFRFGNKETITVTGVLRKFPKNTEFTSKIFISFPTLKSFSSFSASESWGGITTNLTCYGLLLPNQDIGTIESDISGYPEKFRPTSTNKHTYKLQALSDIHLNTEYGGGVSRTTLLIFSLIGLFILGMACINFINISTGQSAYRSKEVGMRKVVGGVKGQLFWQFMVETFLTSLLALAVGIGLSILALPRFNAMFDLTLSLSGLLQPKFIGFIVLLLTVVTFLAGSYPGVLMARVTPILALKNQLSARDIGGSRTRKILVIAQFAIAIMLVVGTLVVNKQLNYAISSDLGYNKEAVMMLSIPTDDVSPIQLDGLKERLTKFQGVSSVTRCLASPGAAYLQWGTSVRYNNNPNNEEFSVQVKAADDDYLNTFQIPLLAGRNYFEKDSVFEVLVNATFAKKVGVDNVDDLLGKRIAINSGRVQGTIVGVLSDFHDRSFQENINPIFMAPISDYYSEFAVKLHTSQMTETIEQVEKEWSNLFPEFVFDYDFLDQRVAEQYQAEQRFLTLTKVFSILAILIGCLGVYGLITYFITQKTKEIGIRKVLGSNLPQILSLLAKDFVVMILLAGTIATPIAYVVMGRWLENYTFKTEISWWIFVLAIGGMVSITMATIAYKALRAARVSPVTSLRTE